MKKLNFISFLLIIISGKLTAQQIYNGDNGLTTTGTGIEKKVSLGGTLNTAGTSIDLGSYTFGFKKSNTNYLFIENTGNVGIGLITPQFKLDVSGDAHFGGKTFIGNSTTPYTLSTSGTLNVYNDQGDGDIQVSGYDSPNKSSLSFNTGGGNGTAYRARIQIKNSSGDLEFLSNALGGRNAGFAFFNEAVSATVPLLKLNYNGSVGINTTTPNSEAKLDVNGNIFTNGKILIGSTLAKAGNFSLAVNGEAIFNRAVVKLYGNWPDYVFEESYKLPSLETVEQFIRNHKHLQGFKPHYEIKKTGVDLGESQKIIVQKIEELTLYLIEQNKQIKSLQAEINLLKRKN